MAKTKADYLKQIVDELKNGPLTGGELAARLKLSNKPTIYGYLKELVEGGVISKTDDVPSSYYTAQEEETEEVAATEEIPVHHGSIQEVPNDNGEEDLLQLIRNLAHELVDYRLGFRKLTAKNSNALRQITKEINDLLEVSEEKTDREAA